MDVLTSVKRFRESHFKKEDQMIRAVFTSYWNRMCNGIMASRWEPPLGLAVGKKIRNHSGNWEGHSWFVLKKGRERRNKAVCVRVHACVLCRCVTTGFFSGNTASLIVGKVQIWLRLRSDLKMTFFINAYCLWVFLASGGRKRHFYKGDFNQGDSDGKIRKQVKFLLLSPLSANYLLLSIPPSDFSVHWILGK